MSFVLDASIAAAWFLPDEQHEAADRLMADLRSASAFVPSLFWFETRNLFLAAERRGRLRAGEARLLMSQLRGFPLEDMGRSGTELFSSSPCATYSAPTMPAISPWRWGRRSLLPLPIAG